MPARMLALTLLLLAALAAPAAAAPTLDVGMADDRVLLDGTDEEATDAVAAWQELGVDTVRVQARWVAHVADPLGERVPPHFDTRDPDSPGYHWAKLDRAIKLVSDAKMRVLLTVTGSGPLWGTVDPQQGNPRYKPSPSKFADFATAVARRYGDRVDDYIIWNEPNHELWIQPQNTCKRGHPHRCRPYAPHLYRKIVRAADPAIRRADPGARIMFGALAPRGTSGRSRNARLRPLAFLRAMGCVDKRYHRVRRGPCRHFKPARAYGFAYHPHGLKLSPTAHSPHRDDAQLGDLKRLIRALDRITRAHGLRSRHPSGRFPLYLDEHGYQTRPPDRYLGVSRHRQSTWLQESAYIAWQHPRVKNLTQYVWRDEPIRRRDGAGWQSGLRDERGRAKPALRTFPHPFWALHLNRRTVRLWGQVRPGRAHTVRLQRRTRSGRWITFDHERTDKRGYFHVEVHPRSERSYRFTWGDEHSSVRTVR